MNPLFIGPLAEIIKTVISRILPEDPEKAAEAQLKVMELQQSGELAQLTAETDLAKAQLQVNVAEAQNPNLFVSGWRPAIGWVAAISLFTYYVPYCLVATYVWAHQVYVTEKLVSRPDLGITDLLGLVAGMLGMAGMRTFEKIKGVAAK
jgi:hypothetical protein